MRWRVAYLGTGISEARFESYVMKASIGLIYMHINKFSVIVVYLRYHVRYHVRVKQVNELTVLRLVLYESYFERNHNLHEAVENRAVLRSCNLSINLNGKRTHEFLDARQNETRSYGT